jgi:hypothetical protein
MRKRILPAGLGMQHQQVAQQYSQYGKYFLQKRFFSGFQM